MTIELSAEQSRAADAVGAWLKSRDKPYFVLHGPAGAGKSTVVSKLISQHNGPVYPMTYTGRAADVLRSKGMPARTVHSWIYLPTGERRDEAQATEAELATCTDTAKERRLRKRLEELYSPEFVKRPTSPFDPRGLVVLDEASQISKKEAEDLLSYGLPTLVMGDPYQLAPIEGRGYFNGRPDFLLTEIHRQAKESPILYLATLAREGKPLVAGNYGTSQVISKSKITPELILGIEQIAVGRNKTRIEFNNEVRKLRGYTSEFPQAGERLMCLRNNSEKMIFNGSIMTTSADAVMDGNLLSLEFEAADGDSALLALKAHPECFTAPELLKSWPYQKRKRAEEFDFTSAATIHRLQGGQFDSVLVYPDLYNWRGAEADYRRLTYVGITRAIDRVVVAL